MKIKYKDSKSKQNIMQNITISSHIKESKKKIENRCINEASSSSPLSAKTKIKHRPFLKTVKYELPTIDKISKKQETEEVFPMFAGKGIPRKKKLKNIVKNEISKLNNEPGRTGSSHINNSIKMIQHGHRDEVNSTSMLSKKTKIKSLPISKTIKRELLPFDNIKKESQNFENKIMS